MHVSVEFHIASVIPGFAHKVAAVARCIDQDIIRLVFNTAFYNGFEELIFDLVFLKGKIIYIYYKFIVAFL